MASIVKVFLFSLPLLSIATADKVLPIIKTNDGLNCRSEPNTSGKVQKTYPTGGKVTVTCQTRGESVNGHNVWDKTTDGCYVSDHYVLTGTPNFVVDACSGTTPAPKKDDDKKGDDKKKSGKGVPKIPESNCKNYVVDSGYRTLNQFPGAVHTVWCYANKPGEHGKGRALDFMVKPRSDEGLKLATWVMNNHKDLKVLYVIWSQRIWNSSGAPRAWEQWKKMENRGDDTANHYDHIHVSYL